jgi:hypothetical protein
MAGRVPDDLGLHGAQGMRRQASGGTGAVPLGAVAGLSLQGAGSDPSGEAGSRRARGRGRRAPIAPRRHLDALASGRSRPSAGCPVPGRGNKGAAGSLPTALHRAFVGPGGEPVH